MAEENKDDGPDIVKVDTYVDREGRQVKEFTPQFVQDKRKSKPIYRGLATIRERSDNPMLPGRHIPLEFTFEEGTTLMGAFKSFDEKAKEALEEFQKEANERSKDIITPGSDGGILGADGRKL
jgi:hypothetical protein